MIRVNTDNYGKTAPLDEVWAWFHMKTIWQCSSSFSLLCKRKEKENKEKKEIVEKWKKKLGKHLREKL